MKKLFFIIPFLLLACFANCKKAKGPANVPSNHINNGLDSLFDMSITIDSSGQNVQYWSEFWQTDSAYSYKVKQSGNDSNVINLLVVATRVPKDSTMKTSTIVINISNYTGPKTYPVNPPVYSITYYNGKERNLATSGSFTVVSDTGRMLRGTFNFGTSTVTGKSGSFAVALP